MQLHLDATYLRETHPIIVGKRVPALGIGEAIIAVTSLKAGIARGFTLLDTPEKGFECSFHS
jgi:hypothetical protein